MKTILLLIIFIIFVAVIFMICSFVYEGLKTAMDFDRKKKMKKLEQEKGIILPMLGIAFVLGLLLTGLFIPFTQIDVGHLGVETRFGKVTGNTFSEGVHLINPLSDVEKFDLRVQKQSHRYTAASKDLQDVTVDMTLNFKLLPGKAAKIYQTVGWYYFEQIMEPALMETLKAEVARHNASEVLAKRPQIKSKIQEDVQNWLEPYGIVIQEVSLADIGFSKEYETAIEQAQLEEQRVKQKRFEAQKEEEQRKIVEIQARAAADRITIEAEAQAEANKILAASLTQPLLELEYYKRWNGILPQYMLGGNSGLLLNVPNNAK